MANMYLGGSNPYSGMWGSNPVGVTNPWRPGQENPQPGRPTAPQGSNPTNPLMPGQETPQPNSPAASQPPNMLGPQAIRPTGPSQGFDPAYLQNLVTTIGGLFSRPQGNLNFNPLGNLSDVSSQGTGFGNSPVPGLPNTMLQDALNGMGFAFPQAASVAPTAPNAGNHGNNGINRNPRLVNQL